MAPPTCGEPARWSESGTLDVRPQCRNEAPRGPAWADALYRDATRLGGRMPARRAAAAQPLIGKRGLVRRLPPVLLVLPIGVLGQALAAMDQTGLFLALCALSGLLVPAQRTTA